MALGSEAAARGQRTIAIGRDGKAVRPGTECRSGARHSEKRHRCHRRWAGRDADGVFRRLPVADPLRGDAHRQPQPAGLQRPENGAGRRNAVGRNDTKSCARVSNRTTSRTAPAATRNADIGADYIARIVSDIRLARPMKDHRGLRQWRGGRLCGEPVPPARLRGNGNVLRSGRALSQPPSRPVRSAQPRRPDRRIARQRQ